ncbi:hypothetical protein ACF07T_40185 [Streptomyces sp. NPDC015184]
MCRGCREKEELAAKLAEQQAAVSARYEVPEAEYTSAGPSPF